MQLFEPHQYQPAANALFAAVASTLHKVLPHARLEHIGASSIDGAISKGDLDICVVVAASEHHKTVLVLQTLGYAIKADTLHTPDLCMLVSDCHDLALQVVSEGSAFDFFVAFRDALRADPDLVARYNQLKRRYTSLRQERYRAEKALFIERVLRGM